MLSVAARAIAAIHLTRWRRTKPVLRDLPCRKVLLPPSQAQTSQVPSQLRARVAPI